MSSHITIPDLQPLDGWPRDSKEILYRILLHALIESSPSILILAENKNISIRFDQGGAWYEGMEPPLDLSKHLINLVRKTADIEDALWGQGEFTVTSSKYTAVFTVNMCRTSNDETMILMYRLG